MSALAQGQNWQAVVETMLCLQKPKRGRALSHESSPAGLYTQEYDRHAAEQLPRGINISILHAILKGMHMLKLTSNFRPNDAERNPPRNAVNGLWE